MAAGYTLTLHAALWLPITLLGAYYMTRAGLKWEKVQSEYKGMQSGEADDGRPPSESGGRQTTDDRRAAEAGR